MSFLFGVVMAMRSEYWEAVVDMRKPALILTLGCAVLLAMLFPGLPAGAPDRWQAFAGRVLAGTFQWCAIVAILGYAKIWLNSENAVIRYLNRAVLTYYVLHQTVMLVIAYWLRELGLMSASSFMPIVVATLAICALCYELKRRLEISWKARIRAGIA